ncbi:uncharacterized protein BJX67DRAFT_103976 [Aspergillus lucknowensis]|uniref:Uncharacterized protein n=1 Tax=Aspergillus lucknowensis TaxID=176173 RepID=A0ABR4M6M9_9EURO
MRRQAGRFYGIPSGAALMLDSVGVLDRSLFPRRASAAKGIQNPKDQESGVALTFEKSGRRGQTPFFALRQTGRASRYQTNQGPKSRVRGAGELFRSQKKRENAIRQNDSHLPRSFLAYHVPIRPCLELENTPLAEQGVVCQSIHPLTDFCERSRRASSPVWSRPASERTEMEDLGTWVFRSYFVPAEVQP